MVAFWPQEKGAYLVLSARKKLLDWSRCPAMTVQILLKLDRLDLAR